MNFNDSRVKEGSSHCGTPRFKKFRDSKASPAVLLNIVAEEKKPEIESTSLKECNYSKLNRKSFEHTRETPKIRKKFVKFKDSKSTCEVPWIFNKSKQQKQPNKKKILPSSDSESDSDSTEESNTAKKPKINEKLLTREKITFYEKKVTNATLPLPSSSSSSDSNNEVPELSKKPTTINTTDQVDVVDDVKKQSMPQTCVVCSEKDHSSLECRKKCIKCSHSIYKVQMVCKNCGVTYGQSLKCTPNLENPFLMFMKFIQFRMSQCGYLSYSSDIKYPFPQFENQSAPVLGPVPPVEVTRKDIDNCKRKQKKSKTKKKHSRRKLRQSISSENDSDSNSSSWATSSIKQKKSSKSSAVAAHQLLPQPQQLTSQNRVSLPAELPFGNAFNPFLAFSQMMSYNRSTMNFKHN